jgi:ATPase family associated with various cellular activities (AAA)
MATPHIPTRFGDEVDRHLVLNFAGLPAWPLVLGVFGRPGDGKSYQVREQMSRRGVLCVSINAADLESDRAGQPGKLVLAKYEEAGHRTSEGSPGALLVDDFDTTVGEWDNSTTTVNHQQVLAQLMHLADTPTEAAGKPLRRIPVFVTGNDLSKVYPPLRRPGRMRPFHWLPTDVERQDIVTAILADALAPADTAELLAKLPEAPIAFFSDLQADIIATAAAAEIGRQAQDLRTATRKAGRAREQLEKYLTVHKASAAEIVQLALGVWNDRALATVSHIDE